jgi:homoserine kinase type II
MDNSTRDSLLAAYGLDAPVALLPLSGGVNNTNYLLASRECRLVLKRYETSSDAESLNYEHRLLAWLATQGLPFALPAPRPSPSGTTLVQVDGALWALFTWLPGEPPHPTAGQAEAFGQALGELHRALASFPLTPRPGMAPYGALDRVHPAVPDPEQLDQYARGLVTTSEAAAAQAWWKRDVRALQAFVNGPYRQLPWQVVHGDVAFSNSLFVGERLSAMLDFEFAGPDARAIDLAAAIYGLLRHEAVDAVVPAVRSLLRGYQRTTVLAEVEQAALPQLIRLRSAVDTIWWVGRYLAEGQREAAVERMGQAWQRAIRIKAHVRSLHSWLH